LNSKNKVRRLNGVSLEKSKLKKFTKHTDSLYSNNVSYESSAKRLKSISMFEENRTNIKNVYYNIEDDIQDQYGLQMKSNQKVVYSV